VNHLEIESKFDATDEQVVPDLVGVGVAASVFAPAEMVLTATYYDTDRLALAATGATLRRRTGGADDGWHLKLPVATGEKLEVQRPLGRSDTPPAALTALLRAVTRTDALVPVASLVTRRVARRLLDDEGRVLVEIADDRVTGERLGVGETVSWREVEVELVDGDRDSFAAVAAAMSAAGFVPATGSSKVGRVLGTSPAAVGRVRRRTPVVEVLDAGRRAAVRSLLTADPLLRVDRAGAAAGMRAAIHRLRAALATSGQVMPRGPEEPVLAELGWLDDVVAALDQVDTVRPRLRATVGTEPRELVLGPVVRRIDRQLSAARKEALASVLDALDSTRYLELLAALEEETAGEGTPGIRAGDVLPALAERNIRRAERRLGRLRRAQSDQERRRQLAGARRAVERARYVEDLRPGASSAAVLDEAAGLLAELEASTRSQVVLRMLAVQAQLAGESAFTFGRLHGLEDLRAHLLRHRLNLARKGLKRARTK